MTSIPLSELPKFGRHMAYKHDKYSVLYWIGIDTGARVTDILNLTVHQLYAGYVTERKTGKRKELTISPSTRLIIDNHIKTSRLGLADYLVYSRNNRHDKPLSRSQAFRVLRNVAHDLGYKRIAPHSMRKAYAQILFNRTHDLETVRQALNHKYITTTFYYLCDDFSRISFN